MRSSHSLDRLDVAFDGDRLVADAGLLLPATLAHHLGLKELVETHLDLGTAAGRANAGDELLTLVMSALAGGDCIDDANALRAGAAMCTDPFHVVAWATQPLARAARPRSRAISRAPGSRSGRTPRI